MLCRAFFSPLACSRGEDKGEEVRTSSPRINRHPARVLLKESPRISKSSNTKLSTSKIHPTALVDSNAKLGVNVEIGPFCIIGPQVRLGDESVVQSHVVIEGEVTVGRRNLIGHGAIVGAPPQDVSFSPDRKTRIEIGDDNIIREYCTIHRGSADGTATKIGDKNFLMAGAHVGHNCVIGNNVLVANNCLLAGYVRVDDGAFLGGGSTFHQFMRIGRLVMVQGSSAFGKDLPPFVVAAERNCVFGLNIIGLRRAGVPEKDRGEIKAAFKLIYLSGLNTSQALQKAETMGFGAPAREFLDFVAGSKKRGVCPFKRGRSGDVTV
jgi:UDP-N-acetylglucosamine acyltransferase